jgi:hypothetical protein
MATPLVFTMATPLPLGLDTITLASAAAEVAPVALAAAIATLQDVAASRQRVVGAVTTTSALVGTAAGTTAVACPHPQSALPSSQPARTPLLAPPRAPPAP